MKNVTVVTIVVHVVVAVLINIAAASLVLADASVKVTPLGSHAGEFCRSDRALIFEDPSGTRLLYDAGRTVAGPTDSRPADRLEDVLLHVSPVAALSGQAVQPCALEQRLLGGLGVSCLPAPGRQGRLL